MSDAYALSVALLAERIAGRGTLSTPWPKVTPLSTNEVKSLQRLLAARGFYRGGTMENLDARAVMQFTQFKSIKAGSLQMDLRRAGY